MHRTGVVSQRFVLQVVHMEQLVPETCRCYMSPSVSRPLRFFWTTFLEAAVFSWGITYPNSKLRQVSNCHFVTASGSRWLEFEIPSERQNHFPIFLIHLNRIQQIITAPTMVICWAVSQSVYSERRSKDAVKTTMDQAV